MANKLCEKCGNDLDQCENCERWGCLECEEGWKRTRDDVWLCPECAAAILADWNKETENGTKICGTCSHFSNDDDEDYGVCGKDGGDYPSNYHCKHWTT